MYTFPSAVINFITYTALRQNQFPTITYTVGATAGFEVVTLASDLSNITVQIQSGVSTNLQIQTAIANALGTSVDGLYARDLVSVVITSGHNSDTNVAVSATALTGAANTAIPVTTFNAAALRDGDVEVGSVSGFAQDVVMSGDATMSDTGALTIANSAITNAKVSPTAAIAVTKLAALTASIVPVTDGSGKLSSSSTTSTELGYVHGVTSSIQSQFNALFPGIALLASDPMTPTEGQVWYNTTSHLLKFYNGTVVKTVTTN